MSQGLETIPVPAKSPATGAGQPALPGRIPCQQVGHLRSVLLISVIVGLILFLFTPTFTFS